MTANASRRHRCKEMGMFAGKRLTSFLLAGHWPAPASPIGSSWHSLPATDALSELGVLAQRFAKPDRITKL
jgi:hypothetical protein